MKSSMEDLLIIMEFLKRMQEIWWQVQLTGEIYNKLTLMLLWKRLIKIGKTVLQKIWNMGIFSLGFYHLRIQMLDLTCILQKKVKKLHLDHRLIGQHRLLLQKFITKVASKILMLRRKSNCNHKFLIYLIILNMCLWKREC